MHNSRLHRTALRIEHGACALKASFAIAKDHTALDGAGLPFTAMDTWCSTFHTTAGRYNARHRVTTSPTGTPCTHPVERLHSIAETTEIGVAQLVLRLAAEPGIRQQRVDDHKRWPIWIDKSLPPSVPIDCKRHGNDVIKAQS
jgi:hypothetical protein